MIRIRRSQFPVALAFLLFWLGAGLFGFWALNSYTSRGTIHIDAAPAVVAVEDRQTLILFGHPHCPCFSTSLAIFADVVERTGTRQRAEIVFVRPVGVPEGWERSLSWDAAAALKGVRVSCDVDGERARRLGAATSGETLLIDKDGTVRFRGGITRPGSHAGDNVGRNRLLAILDGQTLENFETPVYGCTLN